MHVRIQGKWIIGLLSYLYKGQREVELNNKSDVANVISALSWQQSQWDVVTLMQETH